MTTDDEWGPWIEWAGGAPCPIGIGEYIEVVERDRYLHDTRRSGRATAATVADICWQMMDCYGPKTQIIRFRVRKPRGMQVLREALVTESA
jgi:hypothetical protein